MQDLHYKNIRTSILEDRSKANIDRLITYVGSEEERIVAMLSLLEDFDRVVRRRGSWIIGNYAQEFPKTLENHLSQIIAILDQEICNYDQAVLRNVLKVLEYNLVPEIHEGLVYNKCVQIFTNLSMEIAPRAFAITVAMNIAKKYPELKYEFQEWMNIIQPDQSPAIQARIRQVKLKM